MKRVLCILAMLFVMLGNPLTVLASENEQPDVTISGESEIKKDEYQMYRQMQMASSDELRKAGYTESEIRQIKTTSYETLLYQRAQLSEEELSAMGYTMKEIELLKTYQGQALTKESAFYGLVADVTATIQATSASTSQYRIAISYVWSGVPLQLWTDVVAVTWKGASASGGVQQVSIDKNNSYTLQYYYMGTLTEVYATAQTEITSDDMYGRAKGQITMQYNNSDVVWARAGIMILTLNAVQSGQVAEMTLSFDYGHRAIVGNPSVSFNDMAIDFDMSTLSMCPHSCTIDSDRHIVGW